MHRQPQALLDAELCAAESRCITDIHLYSSHSEQLFEVLTLVGDLIT